MFVTVFVVVVIGLFEKMMQTDCTVSNLLIHVLALLDLYFVYMAVEQGFDVRELQSLHHTLIMQ